MVRLAYSVVVLLLVGSSTPANESAPTSEWIAKQVTALDSPRFSEREAASRELLRIGEPALKALEEASQSSRPERSRRAAELARSITWQLENDRLLSDMPTLRFQFDGVPLRTAVSQFAAKTGLKLSLDTNKVMNASRPITLDTGDVPFWEAVEKFYEVAELRESLTYTGNQQYATPYTIVQGNQVITSYRMHNRPTNASYTLISGTTEKREPCWTAGPVRVRVLPNNGSEVSNLNVGNDALPFTLEITPYPGLNANDLVGVRLHKVIDDSGRSLSQSHLESLSNDMMGGYDGAFGGQIIVAGGFGGVPNAAPNLSEGPHHYPVAIRVGDIKPRSLPIVEGTVALHVQTGPHLLLNIDNPTEKIGQEFTSGDITLKVIGLTKLPNGMYQLQVQVRSQSMSSNVLMARQMGGIVRPNRGIPGTDGEGGLPVDPTNGGLQLLDSDGQEFRRSGSTSTSQSIQSGPNGIEVIMNYQLTYQPSSADAVPARLHLNGTKPFLVRVPFVLKNVPLP